MTLPLWCVDDSFENNDHPTPKSIQRRPRLVRVGETSYTDEAISRIQQGDHNAFTELVELYYERVVRVAWSVVKSKDVAQDIAQDLFVRLWARREDLEADHLSASYLMAAAYNRGLDELKSRRVRLTHREVVKAEAVSGASRMATPSPEDSVLSRAEFEAAMEKLPDRWRAVVRLRFQEQLTIDELAAALEIAPNAVHQLVHRAVWRLRQLLTDSQGETRKSNQGEIV
jgi:RNA polymerase sigma-70 factor (ECF subfamily)